MTYDQEVKFRQILNPLRAEFENSAANTHLDLSRERQWYMSESLTEEDRPIIVNLQMQHGGVGELHLYNIIVFFLKISNFDIINRSQVTQITF